MENYNYIDNMAKNFYEVGWRSYHKYMLCDMLYGTLTYPEIFAVCDALTIIEDSEIQKHK